jgi:hypothetical protein
MHSDGVLIQHYIGAFHANRAAEFAQHLFQPRVGLRRRAIDQARRILGYDMLECCSPSERKGARAQPQAEMHGCDEQQQRDQI